MRLVGLDGDSLSLTIAGYQFPDAENPQQRYSWHNIEGEATKGDETWSFRYPALTCDESARVAPWILSLRRPVPLPSSLDRPMLSFTEPNLRFERLERSGADVTLAVALDLEFQPPRKRAPGQCAGDPTVLILRLTDAVLEAAAEEWSDNLSLFPDGLL